MLVTRGAIACWGRVEVVYGGVKQQDGRVKLVSNLASPLHDARTELFMLVDRMVGIQAVHAAVIGGVGRGQAVNDLGEGGEGKLCREDIGNGAPESPMLL